ncbi:hypothetical protein G7Z17_g12559 [Cylindrodendrum hubeiense]|uniref:Zn(2)-C6 fungal-type domain-containing protein n=1 Tax=Cylindrodendrum hubeiense TaxID=595255 RepID=A0A9P5GYS6_9HYPO|nr:hypothetical protein G7Z17_g12559 [Cylindrodendrum hubeiense]
MTQILLALMVVGGHAATSIIERTTSPFAFSKPLPETFTLELDQFVRSTVMMVTPPTYFPPGEVRRYANRAGAYPPSYPERRATAVFPVYPSPRESMMSDMDELSTQRKRIAVACGRCRKRKIRCSGDTGNGAPCINCRNAGWEPCQYLRVASQEAQMKNETFTYNIEASRQYHAGGTSPAAPIQAASPQYDGPSSIQAEHEALAFRPGSSATFSYSARPFDAASQWASGLPVEHGAVTYGVYTPTYHGQQSHQDQELGINYRIGASSTDPGTMGFQNVQNVHNAAPAAEVHQRALPTRIRRAALPTSGASPYRNDSCSPVCGKSSQSSSSGASPMTPGSEASPGYTGYETPSPSMATTAASYSAMRIATQPTRPNDIYAATGTSEGSMYSPGSAAAGSTRPAGSGPDMTYRYTDTTAGTASPVTGTIVPKLERNSSADAALALSHLHGPAYVGQNHGQSASYMMPSDVQGGAGTEADAEDSEHKAAVLRT